jgi:uncharacterized protein
MPKKYKKAVNQSNGSVIAHKIQIADNFVSRLVGLLNRKNIDKDEGLLIVPSKSIHSFGMQFDFDAVFLDKNNKVVYLIEKMKPFKVSPLVKNSKSVLELAAGVISLTNIKVGDVLDFQN